MDSRNEKKINFSCNRCQRGYKIEKYFLAHVNKCEKISCDNDENKSSATTTTTATPIMSAKSNKDIQVTNEKSKTIGERKDEVTLSSDNHENSSPEFDLGTVSKHRWGKTDLLSFGESIDHAYEKIVHWRNNLFLLPSGKAGKEFIDEMTRLIIE